jgi:HB1, ASXL, restriction endonuclease HTH domain
MTAKKNALPSTSPKTHKGRRLKAAAIEDLATEAPPLPEPTPAEAAKTSADLTAESSPIGGPTPAEEAPAKEEGPTEAAPPSAKLSALDAAAKVLGETGQAMNCQELIAAMAAQGYWSSPRGRTPAGTLYSAVLREIQTRGDQARFRKTERGKFALRENV